MGGAEVGGPQGLCLYAQLKPQVEERAGELSMPAEIPTQYRGAE